MADFLPESTNACPTLPTADHPELLREAFEAGVRAAESEGFIVMSEAVADQMFAEFMDSRDDNTRLTSTTPTLGDMVMVPREPTEAMWDAANEHGGIPRPARVWSAMIAAAPASPIPISVNGAGDGWEYLGSINDPIRSVSEAGNPYLSYTAAHVVAAFKAGHAAALSPALDNTADKRASAQDALGVLEWGLRKAGMHTLADNVAAGLSVSILSDNVLPIIAALSPALDSTERHPGWTKDGHDWLDAGAPMAVALDNTALEGLRPFSDWHEDHGDVLWWKLPIHESPYVGSPLDMGRSMKVEIYIGFEQHEFPIKNTGGWPFDESDEAGLYWSPLPDVRAVTDAVAALTAETEKAR